MRRSVKLCGAIAVIVVVVAAFVFRDYFVSPEENKYEGLSSVEYYPAKSAAQNGGDSAGLSIVTCCQGAKCMKHFHNLADSLSVRGYNFYRIEMKGEFSWR